MNVDPYRRRRTPTSDERSPPVPILDRTPLTGMPCDSSHPYPAPDRNAQIDATEYGIYDREDDAIDPAPIFRLIAADLWGARCYDQHRGAVAADSILTAHTIAVATVAYAPEHANSGAVHGFEHSGAAAVINALRDGGQKAGLEVVDTLPLDVRREAVGECVAHLNHGLTALHLDIEALFLR